MRARERKGERRRIVGLEFAGDIVEARQGEAGGIDLRIVFARDRPAEYDGQALPPEPVPQLRSTCFYGFFLIARAHVSFAGRGPKRRTPLKSTNENIKRTFESSRDYERETGPEVGPLAIRLSFFLVSSPRIKMIG